MENGPPRTSDYEEISKAIRQLWGEEDAPIILVDGLDGSGKTHLARRLANDLGIVHIEADLFLEPGKVTYLNALDYECLARTIRRATERNTGTYRGGIPVLLDAVAALDVADRLAIRAKFHLYVQDLGYSDWWGKEFLYYFPEDGPDEKVNEARQERLSMIRESGHEPDPIELSNASLKEELIRYTTQKAPHKAANLIYQRRREE